MEQHVDGPPEERPAVLLRQVRETSTAYQHDCRQHGCVLQTHRPGRSPNFIPLCTTVNVDFYQSVKKITLNMRPTNV
jgi:hypothetical protein